jgi:hypothetical protein
MSKYDWAVESHYLADELDRTADKADRASEYLAELESGRENIIRTALTTGTHMATAGSFAYMSQTLFATKDAKTGASVPGMFNVGPIGADLLTGIAGKLAALFASKLKIPAEAIPYIDAIGTGALDHWAVVTAQHAGAASNTPPVPTKTSGVHGPVPALGGGQPDRTPVMGGGNRDYNRPEMGGGVGAGHRDPQQYMTPAQRSAWNDYAG